MRNRVKVIMVVFCVVLFAAASAPRVALCDGSMPTGGGSWGKSGQQNEDGILSGGAKKPSPPIMRVGADKPQSHYGYMKRSTIPPNVRKRSR